MEHGKLTDFYIYIFNSFNKCLKIFFRLNDNVKSFRGCSELENMMSLMNKKKYYLRF